MAAIKSMDQARTLREARLVFETNFPPSFPIWSRLVRNNRTTNFTRAVWVQLMPNFDLRVVDYRTGQVLAQGPAKPS